MIKLDSQTSVSEVHVFMLKEIHTIAIFSVNIHLTCIHIVLSFFPNLSQSVRFKIYFQDSRFRGSIGGARPRPAGISIVFSTYRLCSEMVRIGEGASWQRPTRGVQGCCSDHLQSDSGQWTPDRLEPDHLSRDTDRAVLCGVAILWAVWGRPSQRDPPHRSTACNNTVGVTRIQNEIWIKQKHEFIGKFLHLCDLKHDIILFPYLLQSFYL